jgi:type 1 fimbria pilin
MQMTIRIASLTKGSMAALLMAVTPEGTRADDRLDFEVTGAVVASCGLADQRIRIDLGSVAYGDLGRVGAASPWRRAAFSGVDCVGATRAAVTLRARPYPPDPRLLQPEGTARGVAIEMRTGAGESIVPDGKTPVGFSWPGGSPQLAFEARYVRTGDLGAGDATATAVIEITWE